MLEKERDEFLEEIYDLVKENNKMLRAEKRARIFAGLFKILWLILVIGVPVWLYFTYLEPMIGNMQNTVTQLEGLTKVNPQLGAQLEPIIQSIKTLMGLFGTTAN